MKKLILTRLYLDSEKSGDFCQKTMNLVHNLKTLDTQETSNSAHLQTISHTQEKHLQQLYHNGITAISIFEASSRKIKSLHATLEIFKSPKGILRVCTHHLASSGTKASNHKASRKQNESQRSTGEGIKAFRKTKKSKHQESRTNHSVPQLKESKPSGKQRNQSIKKAERITENKEIKASRKQNESQRSTVEGIKAFRKTKKSKYQEGRTNHSVPQVKESKPSGKQEFTPPTSKGHQHQKIAQQQQQQQDLPQKKIQSL
ncbi:hypothetical protein Avbf_18114 [Armadillidium vulgare]|nr:hypothetical protein Avbf_18114 [Armadillidium vulgare]